MKRQLFTSPTLVIVVALVLLLLVLDSMRATTAVSQPAVSEVHPHHLIVPESQRNALSTASKTARQVSDAAKDTLTEAGPRLISGLPWQNQSILPHISAPHGENGTLNVGDPLPPPPTFAITGFITIAGWHIPGLVPTSTQPSIHADIAIGPDGSKHITWSEADNHVWYMRLDQNDRIVVPAQDVFFNGRFPVRIAVDGDNNAHVIVTTSGSVSIPIYIKINSDGTKAFHRSVHFNVTVNPRHWSSDVDMRGNTPVLITQVEDVVEGRRFEAIKIANLNPADGTATYYANCLFRWDTYNMNAVTVQGAVDSNGVAHAVWVDSVDGSLVLRHCQEGELNIVTLAGSNPFLPDLKAGLMGRLHVAWESSSSGEIFYARLLDNGSIEVGPLQVSNTMSDSLRASVAPTQDNSAFVVWAEGDTQPRPLYFAEVSSAGVLSLTQRLSAAPWNAWLPRVATGNQSIPHLVWTDSVNDEQRIWYTKRSPLPWTLMFYLDGDNDLAGTYPPILNRLEAAANNPNVNVIVLWDSSGSNDSAYYHVKYDTDLNHLALYTANVNYWPQGEADMDNPSTLIQFVNWAKDKFPAQHYALILDNHGSGLGGAMVDGTDYGSWMRVPEIGLALDQIALKGKIDVLYMAACLMGMIEDAYQVRNSVDYYVANENLQAAFYEPYTPYVSGITADSTSSEVANLFASAYADVARLKGYAYTISSANMMRLSDLVTATNHLADLLNTRMDTISDTLTTVASTAQRYDVNGNEVRDSEDTYVDLYDFAYRVGVALPNHPDIVTATHEVTNAVSAYVIYESHLPAAQHRPDQYNVSSSHGVSIFFPETASSFYNASNYDFAVGANWPGGMMPQSLSQDVITWGPMLVSYFQATEPGGPDDPSPPQPISKLIPPFDVFLPIVMRVY